jgi:sensor histidine kinase YesM
MPASTPSSGGAQCRGMALPMALNTALRLLGLALLISGAWAAVVAVKMQSGPDPASLATTAKVLLRVGSRELVVVLAILAVSTLVLHLCAPERWPRLPRTAAMVLATLAATAAGVAVSVAHLPPQLAPPFSMGWFLLYVSVRHAALAALFVAFREFSQRQHDAAQTLHQGQLRSLALQGELAQAQMSVLQAQVEPHFLFNSLAHVRRLIHTEPQAASALLAALLRYLEEALPKLRHEHSTLQQEAELVRAFLAVHQVRMGARLTFDIDVPAPLAHIKVPSMMLLTLVENAIKHGLQPLVEGGMVRLSARSTGAMLELQVADSGRGMGSGLGHGTGLANLRARLRAGYGHAAELSLQVNEPRGMVATVRLPLPTP